jgi:hypothetical protein
MMKTDITFDQSVIPHPQTLNAFSFEQTPEHPEGLWELFPPICTKNLTEAEKVLTKQHCGLRKINSHTI